MGNIEKCEGFSMSMNSRLKNAVVKVDQSKQALGHALLMRHIGRAETDEVNQARVAVANAEITLSDLEIIKPLLPNFIQSITKDMSIENMEANKKRLAESMNMVRFRRG